MNDLHAQFNTLDYPLDMPEVEACLAAAGLPFTRVPGALRCELTGFGIAHSILYLVPAEAVLLANASEASFGKFQEELVGAEYFAVRGKQNQFLLLVGSKALLSEPAHRKAIYRIEADRSYAAKVFLHVEDLSVWFNNPFALKTGSDRANAVPALTTRAEVNLPPEDPSPADSVFYQYDILREAKQNFPEGLSEQERRVANVVYRRIMGFGHQIHWAENRPALGYDDSDKATPVDLASTGECAVFAYAVFLARAANTVTPGMCIGIHAGLDRLDNGRFIFALDCLRDFVIATGASVDMQSARGDVRKVAEFRIGNIFEAAKLAR